MTKREFDVRLANLGIKMVFLILREGGGEFADEVEQGGKSVIGHTRHGFDEAGFGVIADLHSGEDGGELFGAREGGKGFSDSATQPDGVDTEHATDVIDGSVAGFSLTDFYQTNIIARQIKLLRKIRLRKSGSIPNLFNSIVHGDDLLSIY